MPFAVKTLGLCCALALGTSTALAADKDRVRGADDGEWISMTGTVKSTGVEQFTLNYGDGEIAVEMDDYDAYRENLLLAGDKVTVTGRMDRDFYDRKSIEASSVFVPKINRYFYASSSDEEDGYYSYPATTFDWNGVAEDDEWIVITGTVTRIDGEEMTIDTGLRDIAVDGSSIENNPIGNAVDVGERVSVSGEMDDADLFDRREIEASSVVVLSNNAG